MASGYFTDTYSEYIYSGEVYKGGACTCNVRYESSWVSGNTHAMTVWIYPERKDGDYYTTMSIYVSVGGESSSGAYNYPTDEYYGPITFNVDTDDYGNVETLVKVSASFYSSTAKTDNYGNATSDGLVIDPPPKQVNITCPDGMLCSVDNVINDETSGGNNIYVGNSVSISVTIVGIQWGDYILSVTGATLQDDMTYVVTGDLYIVVTGILAKHTIYINVDQGMSVEVINGDTGYSVNDGAVLEHYSYITITCQSNPGYVYDELKINGEKYENGATIQVLSDITIVITSVVLGTAHVFTGTYFEKFYVFIYDGSEWGMYIPFVYDGSSWSICA